jgi:hypothetical protein
MCVHCQFRLPLLLPIDLFTFYVIGATEVACLIHSDDYQTHYIGIKVDSTKMVVSLVVSLNIRPADI